RKRSRAEIDQRRDRRARGGRMVAKVRRDGAGPRAAAGEIHPALPELRDRLQSRGRHGEALHRETRRRRSGEEMERIRETLGVAATSERINHEWTRIDTNSEGTHKRKQRQLRFRS